MMSMNDDGSLPKEQQQNDKTARKIEKLLPAKKSAGWRRGKWRAAQKATDGEEEHALSAGQHAKPLGGGEASALLAARLHHPAPASTRALLLARQLASGHSRPARLEACFAIIVHAAAGRSESNARQD